MIALAMLYAAAVGGACASAAWLAERAVAVTGRAARWGWAGALAMSVALPAVALWQATLDSGARQGDATGMVVERTDATAWWRDGRATRARVAESSRWMRGFRAIPRHVTAPRGWAAFDRALLAAWLVLTAGTLGRIGAAARRTRRISRTWPVHVILGECVRLSDDVGPAAVGAWRAQVVLPRWALDDARLPLMLAHECEHVRAHDVRLLTTARVAAALLPWSPAVWWLVRRLHAAVELDCDRRVLAGHATPDARGVAVASDTVIRRYGTLLLDVAARPNVGAPALTLGGAPALLHRRIDTMLSHRSRAPRRAIVPALAAAAVLAAACEIPKPTGPAPTTQIALTSIASADPSIAPFAGQHASIDAVRAVITSRMPELLTAPTHREQHVWVVQRADGTIERAAHTDGARGLASTRGSSRAAGRDDPVHVASIDPSRIASVEVLRIPPGRVGPDSVRVVWVVYHPANEVATSRTMVPRPAPRVSDVVARVVTVTGARAPLDSALVIVDGRVAGRGHAALDAVSPDAIDRMDVLNGAVATGRYGDEGRAGVLVITTKKPAGS